MVELLLERFAYTPWGTFGLLTVMENAWYTVEEVWRDNEAWVSCIPTGEYRILPVMHGVSGDNPYPAYRLQEVPGRSEIDIHIANTINGIDGCIGLGTKLDYIYGLWAVGDSRTAFGEFMRLMDGREGHIKIVDRFPFNHDARTQEVSRA